MMSSLGREKREAETESERKYMGRERLIEIRERKKAGGRDRKGQGKTVEGMGVLIGTSTD